MTTKAPTTVASRGARTRTALLDAAEREFARLGYFGASIRDIASDAGVKLGLVHYHFENKEDLFRKAVQRRQSAAKERISKSFADAEAASPGGLSISETIRAFLTPFLSIAVDPEDELHTYIRMTSHLLSSYRTPELRPVLRDLGSISDVFEIKLRMLMPNAGDADFYAGLYLIESALVFMIQDPGFVDDLTRGHFQANRLDRLVEPAVRLFGAGIEAMSASQKA